MQEAALKAVDSGDAVGRGLQGESDVLESTKGSVYLLAVGKAAAAMSLAAEGYLGDRLEAGLAVTKHGHGLPGLERVRLMEAGHPQPDQAGLEASEQVIAFLGDHLGPQDLLLLLLSGGGSALLPAPVEGVSLQDKARAIDLLMAQGADIHELNALRKHLSRLKGGRLLDHCAGCRVLALLVSDVVGDDPSSIASGPAAADPTSFQDCLRILEEHEVEARMPASVMEVLKAGAQGGRGETPKPGDPRFKRVRTRIIADNRRALLAAADVARAQGFRPLVLSSTLEGDTAEAARFHASMAREVLQAGLPLPAPCCLLSGGETTVRVSGEGKGGRNQEFALWCARYSRQFEREVLFVSLGTDGGDGPTDAAGAWSLPSTCQRAAGLGLECRDFLRRNDSYHFFEPLGQLLKTGPTHTNVMDVRAVLIPSG